MKIRTSCCSKISSRTMKSIVLLLCVLNLLPYSVATKRWSEDETFSNRIKLGRFAIQLDNTPTQIEPSEVTHVQNLLRKAVEEACEAHIAKQVYASSGEPLKFEYLLLLGVETMEWYDPNDAATTSGILFQASGGFRNRGRRRLHLFPESQQQQDSRSSRRTRNLQKDTTLVVFKGGTAAFDSAIEEVEIEKWVREAISEELVESLWASDTPFSQVTSAKYISLKVDEDDDGEGDGDGASSDGEEDGDGEDDGQLDQQEDRVVDGLQTGNFKLETSSESDGLSSGGKIAFSVVGALVAMAGILVFAKRRQRHANAISDVQFAIDNDDGASNAYDMEEMTEDGAVSHLPAYRSSQRGRAGSGGAGSIDDDAASGASGYTGFTSSVGGDSCDYNGSRTSSSALQPSTSVYRENFDRETRLQKDMLTGDWGYLPTKSNQTTGALRSSPYDQVMIDDPSDDDDPNALEYVHAMSFEKAYDDNRGRQNDEDIMMVPA